MLPIAVLAVFMCAGVHAISFVKPCESSDKECMKQSANAAVPVVAAGVPDLGIETMDPMKIDKIVASQAGLDMNFRKTVITGMKSCRIENIKRDKSKNKIKVEFHCDAVIKGDYTLGGRLLVLPIEGDGTYTITVKDLLLKLAMTVEDKKGEDGKTYWHISDWKHTYKGIGGCVFEFQNLFHGNKELSTAIHNFANSNWKEILTEVGSPIITAIMNRVVDATKTIFSKVPAEELALDV